MAVDFFQHRGYAECQKESLPAVRLRQLGESGRDSRVFDMRLPASG